MNRRVAIAIIATALALPEALAQGTRPLQRATAAQLHEGMQRLSWMLGKWEGNGWVDSATLGRREFSYSQDVRSEFDGLLQIVDGVGYAAADGSTPYARQLLISGPPPAVVMGPPGTYLWQESGPGTFMRSNEAQGTNRSLQVGMPPDAQECDRIVDVSTRDFCGRNRTEMWFRATITLNDSGEWVETRDWQRVGKDNTWVTYFKVVLRRVTQQQK